MATLGLPDLHLCGLATPRAGVETRNSTPVSSEFRNRLPVSPGTARCASIWPGPSASAEPNLLSPNDPHSWLHRKRSRPQLASPIRRVDPTGRDAAPQCSTVMYNARKGKACTVQIADIPVSQIASCALRVSRDGELTSPAQYTNVHFHHHNVLERNSQKEKKNYRRTCLSDVSTAAKDSTSADGGSSRRGAPLVLGRFSHRIR